MPKINIDIINMHKMQSANIIRMHCYTKSFISISFILAENQALFPSIDVLPCGFPMLSQYYCIFYAQLLLRPQQPYHILAENQALFPSIDVLPCGFPMLFQYYCILYAQLLLRPQQPYHMEHITLCPCL